MKLRELQPAVAWNDVERRAIVTGIVGFFASAVCYSFVGLTSSGPRSFSAGAVGFVGFFLTTIAALIGYYHRKIILGFSIAAVVFLLPWLMFWIASFDIFPKRLLIAGFVALNAISYLGLHQLHITLSGARLHQYLDGLTSDEQPGDIKGTLHQVVFYVCFFCGVALLFLLLKSF